MYKEIEKEIAIIKEALAYLKWYECGDELEIDGIKQDWYDPAIKGGLCHLYYAAKSIAEKIGKDIEPAPLNDIWPSDYDGIDQEPEHDDEYEE